MTHKTVYWDTETQSQKERDCTPEEVAEIESRRAAYDPAAAEQALMVEYLAEVRALRERVLNRLAGIVAAALVLQDTVVTDAFVVVRQQLLDMTAHPAVRAATTRAELSVACKAAYALIVAGCPAVLQQAILTVDA